MTEKKRVLIVDDTPSNIKVLNELLKDQYHISAALSGPQGLNLACKDPKPDLVILDLMMPGMDGYGVIERLKADRATKNIPVLFVTGSARGEDEEKGLRAGAVDFITKPFNPSIVKARIQNHMNLHLYQENLESLVAERTEKLRQGYIDTVHRLTLAAEFKDEDTGAHIRRISFYTRELALAMGLDREFADILFHTSPMHDIGKVAIPDSIILKQGPLSPDEWAVMKTHTTTGARILEGSDSPFLKMAVDIAKSHHERWDGRGYPLGLSREQIPLTARIMNIADQYDALRSQRPYKKAFDHEKTFAIITKGDGRTMPEHFDPEVLEAFCRSAGVFQDIYETHKEILD